MDVILFTAYSHSCQSADHRLRGSDRTCLGNYPVTDKDIPLDLHLNTGEVVLVVESNLNNLKLLMSISPRALKITLSCLFGGSARDDLLSAAVYTLFSFSVQSQSIYARPPCSPSVIPDFPL